jgi:hypothetical protein
MRWPVERKIDVLAIEKQITNVTELARSQKVSLKVNITGSCFTESFFI